MAYWGYLPIVKNHINTFFKDHPNVLEIGLDLGQSFVPMLFYLSKNNPNFSLIGCDVLIKDPLKAILGGCSRDLTETQQLIIVTQSSLEFLPELEKQCNELDKPISVAMIDGDHNYHTVKKEFESIPKLLAPGGMVIFDDYDGRWSNQDEFFIEREGYADNEMALSREEGEEEIKGVKPAVDEFLAANPDWVMTKHPQFQNDEPVILFRKNEIGWRHLNEDTDQ